MFGIEIITFVFLLILSALFSSSEVAYTGLSLRQIKRVKRLYPKGLRLWENNPDRVLATLVISNNAVNVGVGVLAASVALHLSVTLGWRQSLMTGLLGFFASFIILIFGEIVPKVWARRYTVSWALRVTPVINIWSGIIAPVVKVAIGITNLFFWEKPLKNRKTPFIQQNELNRILTHSSLPVGSRTLLNNVMEFSKGITKDVMTHRADIFAVSIDEPVEKIITSVIQSGYSRLPVYSGSLNNIKGMLYAKDLLRAWRSGHLLVLEDLLRPIRYIPMDMPVPELLRLFRSGHQHLALVVDPKDKKRIMGLVTIEDALEEIVGKIRGED